MDVKSVQRYLLVVVAVIDVLSQGSMMLILVDWELLGVRILPIRRLS